MRVGLDNRAYFKRLPFLTTDPRTASEHLYVYLTRNGAAETVERTQREIYLYSLSLSFSLPSAMLIRRESLVLASFEV